MNYEDEKKEAIMKDLEEKSKINKVIRVFRGFRKDTLVPNSETAAMLTLAYMLNKGD